MNTISEVVSQNLDLSINKPLKFLVYEAFRKTIILGQIPAGERINEKEFSERMNISRTPIRFALQKLVDEDLVEHVPGTGIIVKGINTKDAYEIYAIRKSLDVLATITAMKKMTSKDFEDLRKLLEETEQLNDINEIEAVLLRFSAFNEFIYEKSQMLRLKSIVMKLQEYVIYFRDIAIHAKVRRDKALLEHWGIYQAMIQQNEPKIETLITNHLNDSLSFVIKEMDVLLNDSKK